MNGSRATITGLLETSLYVADLDRSRGFYIDLFGLRLLFADGRMVALEVPGKQVLLLFRQGASADSVDLADGSLPGHDGSGRNHFAFSVPGASLPAWRERLATSGVPIECEKRWARGGTSLYFRDPDGHLGELATPGLWWPLDE
jgi:catechol 2,3-dioxygenase-like lactoylglutathione lyase family enzyme